MKVNELAMNKKRPFKEEMAINCVQLNFKNTQGRMTLLCVLAETKVRVTTTLVLTLCPL